MQRVRAPPRTPFDLKDWYNFPDPEESELAVGIIKTWDMGEVDGTYDDNFDRKRKLRPMLTGDPLEMFRVFSPDLMPSEGFSISTFEVPLARGKGASTVARSRITPPQPGDEELTLDVSVVAGLRPTRPIVIIQGDKNLSIEDLVEEAIKNPPLVPFMDYSLVDGQLTGVVRPNSTPRRVRWGSISMSFANNEEVDGAVAGNNSYAFALARAMGITICASSGDFGRYLGGDPRAWVAWPGSCRDVLSVGGTAVDDQYHEVCWSDSGGGDSRRVDKPPWQAFLPGTTRAQPDVAAVASNMSFVFRGKTMEVGGTSISAPIWASLIASLGLRTFATPLLYGISASREHPLALRDVALGGQTGGTEREDQLIGNLKEWDYCTGLGVPDGKELARAIARYVVDVTRVSINPPSMAAVIGGFHELALTIAPSTATCKDVLWEIVGVKPGGTPCWIDPLLGKVWAQQECELNIKVTTPNGLSDQMYLKVYPSRVAEAMELYLMDITLSITEMTLEVGGLAAAPTYVAKPSVARNKIRSTSWSCKDPSVVECNRVTGELRAIKAGSTTVELCVVSGAYDTIVRGFVVTVQRRVPELVLIDPVYVIPLDLPVPLEVRVPSGGDRPLTSSLSWEVRLVQKNGQATVFGPALPGISVSGGVVVASAPGVWEVRAKAAGVASNARRIYTGVQPVSIEVGPYHTLSMTKGSSRTLFAVAQPYPCVAPLVWESPSTLLGGGADGGSVVSMALGSDGRCAYVTAVETGTARISVKTADGLIERSFIINVVSERVPWTGRVEFPYTQFPDGPSLSYSKAWRRTNLMQATIVPDDATDIEFEWDVIKGTAAAIEKRSGLLTMLTDGEVVVRCRSNSFFNTITVSSQSEAYLVDTAQISHYQRELNMYSSTNAGLRGTVGDVFELLGDVNYVQGYTGRKENRLTWSVYPVSVATIQKVESSEEGSDCTVLALAPGSCTIRAISVAGTVCATATLQVFPAASAVKIILPFPTQKLYAPNTLTSASEVARLDASQPSTLKLNAVVSPSDAMDLSVSWSSSDEDVASILETGHVLAKNPGSCTLTATSRSVPSVSSHVTLEVLPVLGKTIDNPPDMTFEVNTGAGGRAPLVTALPKPIFTPSNTRDQRVTWVLKDTSNQGIRWLREPVTFYGAVGGLAPTGVSVLRNTACRYRCTGTSVVGNLSCGFDIIVGQPPNEEL